MLNLVACKSSSKGTFSTKQLIMTIVTCGMLRVNSSLVMYILSEDSISCSKKRKLQAVQEYWTAKSEQYYLQSDDAPERDSQDSLDHQC